MKKNFAIGDTETLNGATNPYCFTYHVAFVAFTRKKEILDKINIVILENLQLDKSEFYGRFKKEYYRDLLKGEGVTICYTETEALEVLRAWFTKWNIKVIGAHNSGFDFTKTFLKYVVEDFDFIDTQFAFYDTIGHYTKFKKFCADNGYVTAKGNCRMTAEVCYRFISGDNDFVEEHTALSDSEIEVQILFAVWDTHRKFTRNEHKGEKLYLQVKAF